jgi:hypothetical protein
MRLTESEIVAGLSHPNLHVREVVAEYLEDCGRTQADITRRLVAAVDQFGWEEVLEFPNRIASFDLDLATIDWAIGEIEREDGAAPSENMRWHLARMIANAPVEFVRPRLASIVELQAFHDQRSRLSRDQWSNADEVQLRNRLFDESPEACWTMLDHHCREVADVEEITERDTSYAEALVERIASAKETFAGRVHQLLERSEVSNGYEEWQTGFMIELAGRLRLESSAEPVYRQFDKDWDWYNDEIMRALVRIGTPAVSTLVRERYVGSPWYVRLFSHGVFESVHHDSAVDDVLQVLPHEGDEGLRGHLGIALASHFDDRGIGPALAIYREYPDDKERFAIIERLFAHASLANIDLAEKDRWEEQIAAKWKAFGENRGELNRLLESALDDADSGDEDNNFCDDEWLHAGALGSSSRSDREVYGRKLEPIVHTAPQIGRNERCPCGSGKKYKQCCLRTALN